MHTMTVNQKPVALMVRLEPELHEALRRMAFDERRSLNAQLQILLKRSLERDRDNNREIPDPTPAN